MLEAYAADHPELCIVDEFVDDGYSGTSTSRPAFQRLIQDAQDGKVKTIMRMTSIHAPTQLIIYPEVLSIIRNNPV